MPLLTACSAACRSRSLRRSASTRCAPSENGVARREESRPVARSRPNGSWASIRCRSTSTPDGIRRVTDLAKLRSEARLSPWCSRGTAEGLHGRYRVAQPVGGHQHVDVLVAPVPGACVIRGVPRPLPSRSAPPPVAARTADRMRTASRCSTGWCAGPGRGAHRPGKKTRAPRPRRRRPSTRCRRPQLASATGSSARRWRRGPGSAASRGSTSWAPLMPPRRSAV